MPNISIKTRLLIMLLGVSLISVAAVSILNYLSSHKALQDSVFSHLTSVRASKAGQMRQGFEQMQRETRTLGSGGIVNEAARDLIQAHRSLDKLELSTVEADALRGYYAEILLPELNRHSVGTPELATYLPTENSTRFLQYHFIASNPNSPGNKDGLTGERLSFDYARIHALHHPGMRSIASNLQYYDLLIIDIETGDIVYTVEKEVDFGSSLNSGPYAQTNLAKLFRRVQKTPDRGAVHFADFSRYRPSLDHPAAFFATPIMDGAKAIGVLAAQISIRRINTIMTGGEHWEQDGLGESGETVLIGPDNLLRSASRFLIEDPQAYAASLRAHTVPESTILRILDRNSPVLEQHVRTIAAAEALHGRSGSGVITDYRGIEVLGSWAPLGIPDLNWAIVGKIDLDEAYDPIYTLAKDTLVYVVVLLLLITFAVMFMANSFVRPVNDLIARLKNAVSGDIDIPVTQERGDEIGELSQSFHALASNLADQTRALDTATASNQKILEAVMPRNLALRVSRNGDDISESMENVAIIFAEIRGLADLIQTDGADAIALMRMIVDAFDETASQFEVEKVRIIGDTYMAVCGLSPPFYEQARRAVEFSQQLQKVLRLFCDDNDVELHLIVGISMGPVFADVSPSRGFMFSLWGEAVLEADNARDSALEGQVLVARSIFEKLETNYDFVPVHHSGKVPLWALGEPRREHADG